MNAKYRDNKSAQGSAKKLLCVNPKFEFDITIVKELGHRGNKLLKKKTDTTWSYVRLISQLP